MQPERRRCAIYTRKSTEEGLEQDFNSLHAQREACEAYIASQRSEGWKLLPAVYDDGGYSGGSMERPALAQLMADVQAGKVDVIVVYKVDRLTRALSDFARIVDVLDKAGASFVSVTQAFNTTTSMGRLTLNVLLSFAQFEREVTAERIRDKIAASKAKGMWMGGSRPMGYRAANHRLFVIPEEAETVRHIFRRFAVLRSADALAAELARDGIRSATRTSKAGNVSGGLPLRRGPLYVMLSNPVYRGMIKHKRVVHKGEHEPIVDEALWDEVQRVLAANRSDRRLGTNAEHPSLLAGLLVDGDGRPMSPGHACKGGRRYRYYLTHQHHRSDAAAPLATRVSAGDIETLVVDQIACWLGQPVTAALLASEEVSPTTAAAAATRWQAMLAVAGPSALRAMLIGVVRQVAIGISTIAITLDIAGVHVALGLPQPDGHFASGEPLTIEVQFRHARAGKQMKLIVAGEADATAGPDSPLTRLVVRAYAARVIWLKARGRDDGEVAARLGYSRAYLRTLLRIAFLAPDITAAILAGRQPVGLGENRLMRATHLPLDWAGQRAALGF